ncbi:MAG: response regulator [Sulfitobacter sp.]|nr:response regulator [Sulfitobacter sp.]
MTDNKRIMIVEDDALIAMDLEDELSDRGFDPVVASNIPAATRLLDSEALTFAVLDMHLKSETTFALANELRRRDLPFVFLSGNDISALPDDLKDAKVLTKPVLLDDLVVEINAGARPV